MVGGSGRLKSTDITEVTVGSGFFNSHLFDKYNDFQYRPTAGYAFEITRKPKKSIYICLGGDYDASGPAGTDKIPEIYLSGGNTLIKNEG